MSITPGASKNRAARSSGFTLVELLAVMLILAILMTLVVGAAKLMFTDVYVEETKTNMKIIMTAINEYHKDTDGYPSPGGWVSQLAGNEKSRAMISKLAENVWNFENKDKFRDAWGNKIEYSPTGGLAGAPGLTSPGPDGDIKTDDDNVHYNR